VLIYTFLGNIHSTLPSATPVTALSLTSSKGPSPSVLCVGYATGRILAHSIPTSRTITTLSNHASPITHLHAASPPPPRPLPRRPPATAGCSRATRAA
jgi:hypothetical protein